jgi:hypothetical protein
MDQGAAEKGYKKEKIRGKLPFYLYSIFPSSTFIPESSFWPITFFLSYYSLLHKPINPKD